jgi:hypothetical protein
VQFRHGRGVHQSQQFRAVFLQFPGDAPGGAVLVVRQFGVLVQVLVESLLAGPQDLIVGQDAVDAAHHRSAPWGPEKMDRKNRNTFSTSRKIDAARNGAAAASVLRRSRWKSNMVNPAKITKPRTE